jgi:hypothetical protein
MPKIIGNALSPNKGYFIWCILWCNFLASSLLKYKKKKKLNLHFIHLLAWNLLPISQRLQCPKYLSDKKKFCIMKIYNCFMVLVEGPLPWPLTRTKFPGYPSFPSTHEPSEDHKAITTLLPLNTYTFISSSHLVKLLFWPHVASQEWEHHLHQRLVWGPPKMFLTSKF